MMNSSLLQLLVLVGIAIFLILKLRSVLGTRDGHESQPLQRVDRGRPDRRRDFEVIEGGPDRDITDHVEDGSASAKALAAMKLAENGFSVSEFLGGARGAYEMILMAFENGDVEGLRPFLAEDVMDSFEKVISDREAQGLTIDASFVGVSELALQEAEFNRNTSEAQITVRFVAELTSAVRNAAGDIVEGDANAIKRQRDVWAFGREMGSNNPNWVLVATGG
jgi:predicted lipid-binding transport protein (Tim44 family)